MKFEEIISDLKNKIYHPIYFLMGEEAYYIDQISDYIAQHVLTESEKTFNQLVMYGKDSDAVNIINAARRYPMMANHQVIIVKEAQNLKNIDDLAIYIENPLKSTILVVNYKYGSPDKRKKLYKALSAKGKALVFESPRLYDNQVPDWITNYLKKKNFEIEPSASSLLTEFLGSDLSKIVNELEKLMLVIPIGSKKITSQLIEKNIGISKEFNNFELTKALGKKQILQVYRIIDYFDKNPKSSPLIVTVTTLFGYFSKLMMFHYLPDKSRSGVASGLGVNPFFAQEYIDAAKNYSPNKLAFIISCLREYDLKSKGVGNSSASDGELMKELIYKILH